MCGARCPAKAHVRTCTCALDSCTNLPSPGTVLRSALRAQSPACLQQLLGSTQQRSLRAPMVHTNRCAALRNLRWLSKATKTLQQSTGALWLTELAHHHLPVQKAHGDEVSNALDDKS